MTSLILSGVGGAVVGVLVTGLIFGRLLYKSLKWGKRYQQRALAAEDQLRQQDATVYQFVHDRNSIFNMTAEDLARQWRNGSWRGF